MPKVDPRELLTDRTKYPDDLEITLANGDVISVKDYRDAVLPKGDFTRHADQAAAKERDLSTQLQTAQQTLAREIAARQELETRQNTPPPQRTVPAGQITPEDLMNDPVLGPMYREMKATQENLATFQKDAQTRLQAHENAFLTDRFTGQLRDIAARHNARFKDKPFDQAKFLDEYQKTPLMKFDPQTQRSMPDLDTFHREWTREDELKSREADAEQRGIAKGREAAKVPRVPYGRRSAPAGAEQGPKEFKEVTTDVVLNDPEMVGLLNGEEQT